MPGTLVIQSHRNPLPYRWLGACLDSVAGWAQANRYDYRFIGDEIFELLEPALLARIREQPVIASDLARLKCLQRGLAEGYDCAIWCDADFLVFEPQRLQLPESDFALGREVWVQKNAKGKLQAYSKVHNAFLMFRRGNSFLDFYCDTAERLLRLNQGSMPPQFIGPKLLTAMHNLAVCPVMESAGMLSPPVMRDLLSGSGNALQLFRDKSTERLAGANLGSSLSEREGFTEAQMHALIAGLIENGV